jgi:hypothetical protein
MFFFVQIEHNFFFIILPSIFTKFVFSGMNFYFHILRLLHCKCKLNNLNQWIMLQTVGTDIMEKAGWWRVMVLYKCILYEISASEPNWIWNRKYLNWKDRKLRLIVEILKLLLLIWHTLFQDSLIYFYHQNNSWTGGDLKLCIQHWFPLFSISQFTVCTFTKWKPIWALGYTRHVIFQHVIKKLL